MSVLRYRLAVLTGSHFVNDMLNGLLVAVLPLLGVIYHLSYTQIAVLILVNGVSAGLLQPVLASLLESVRGPWILSISPILLSAGCWAFTVTENFGWLLTAMAVGSIGSSLFHPQANRAVYELSVTRRGVIQSTFQVGGNLGMAFAPLGVWYLHQFSLKGSWVFLCLAAIVIVFMFTVFTGQDGRTEGKHHYPSKGGTENQGQPSSESRQQVAGEKRVIFGPVYTLIVVVTCRALVSSGVVSFLPLFLLEAGKITSTNLWLVSLLYLIGGALGTWGGGWLHDKLTERRLIQLSLLLSAPFAILSLVATGVLLYFCLFVFGLCLMSTFSITVLYAQKLLPGRAGLASSLVIGLTSGISGIVMVLLGLVADSIGIEVIVGCLFSLPLVGWVVSLWLPRRDPITRSRDSVLQG